MIVALLLGAGALLMGKNSDANITGKSVAVTETSGEVQKIVIGMKNYNYYPNTVKVKAGQPIKLSLDQSVSGCFRDFTIRQLGIRKYLPNTSDTLEFVIETPGTYVFACSMGMGTGKIIAE